MPTTTSSNPLWDLQSQYLPGTFEAATELYNKGAQDYYPGSTQAGFDPVRAQGLNLGVDAALGSQQQLATGQSNLLGGILGGTDAATNTLAQQAGQATAGQFGGAGTLGSARHAQAANNAASQTILDRQLQASGQVGQAQQNAVRPGQTLSNIGQDFQGYEQSLLDADKERYDYQGNLPFAHLSRYQDQLAPQGIQAPTTTNQQATGIETASGLLGLAGSAGKLFGFFAEGGEVPQGPQANYGWQEVDGRLQLVPQEVSAGSYGSAGGSHTPTQIGWDPSTGTTALAGSGGSFATGDSGPGRLTQGDNYTTYGGHKDIAHQNVDNAFLDYGKQITAGTARPEDNPGYNAGSAAANQDKPVTFTTSSGEAVTKKAKDLVSSDFVGLSSADQSRLAAASMAAAGIKNIGGGYNQDDPTQGILGSAKDAIGYGRQSIGNLIRPNEAGFGSSVRQKIGDKVAVAPESSYDPIGTTSYVAPRKNKGSNFSSYGSGVNNSYGVGTFNPSTGSGGFAEGGTIPKRKPGLRR